MARIATIVILLVSATAFGAGALQNSEKNDEEENRKKAADLNQLADKMEATADFNVAQDEQLGIQAFQALNDAFNEYVIWYYADVNNTELWAAAEDRVANYLWRMLVLTNSSASYYIWEFFKDNPTENEFIIATVENDGFDFVISRDEWDEYPAVTPIPTEQLLLSWNFDPIFTDYILGPGFVSNIAPFVPNEQYSINSYNLSTIFANQIGKIRAQAATLMLKALQSGDLASQLAAAVSVTAVAGVLTNQMSARMDAQEAKGQLAEVKSLVTQNPGHKEASSDKLAPVIMISALLLTFGALVLIII